MSWLQITFEAGAAEAGRIGALLELCGALAVSIVGGSDDERRLQAADEALPLWSRNRVTGLFPEYTDSAAVVRQITQALDGRTPAYTVDLLADQDWACAWMAHYRPIAITDDLWVCPSWIAPPRPDAINVVLDPGMAFGTGEHPTTRLCLAWLAGERLRDRTVVDFGSGSGVLSIAALKLGARSAAGVEIDPQARAIGMENARRNGVGGGFAVYAPDALPAGLAADVVIANMLAAPLVTLASAITSLVKPGGALALCGLLAEQADEVWSRYAGSFRPERRERLGEWVLVGGTKIAPDAGTKR